MQSECTIGKKIIFLQFNILHYIFQNNFEKKNYTIDDYD